MWGDQTRRQGVIRALLDPDRRIAAAGAIGLSSDGVDVLLRAAKTDPALFEFAASAVAAHDPTPDRFQAVLALPAPSPDALTRSLVEISAAMSTADLLTVAEGTPDRALREEMLTRLASTPVALSRMPWSGVTVIGRHQDTVRGLLLLAQTRFELNQPGAALEALDRISPTSDPDLTRQTAALRTLCLAMVDRIDEAVALEAEPETWVRALELVADLPQAPRVLALIDARYTSEMPGDLARRVTSVRRRLGLFVGPVRDR